MGRYDKLSHNLTIRCQQHDHRPQRIDVNEVQHEAHHDGGSDSSVKTRGLAWFFIEAYVPAAAFGNAVSRRGGEDWHGEKAGADDATGKECEGEATRDGLEGRCGLGAGRDIPQSLRMQSDGRRQDDKKGDGV